MDKAKECLSFESLRRFGVEIEINSFDMRNRPIGHDDGELPEGIYYIGNLVKKVTDDLVLIHKWGNDHHNDCWIIKPDGSCGMEVCTPVMKGWQGLRQTCRVVDGLAKDRKVTSDSRCSLHVHVEVADLTEEQLATVLTWWIKCEAVFMDSVPAKRKKNQYCQFLGQTDIFDNVEDGLFPAELLFKKLGVCKYYSVNTFHYQNRKRKTIEFRIMDNECCLNPWMTKNWVRLILFFVERAIRKGMPSDYQFNDRWSGYSWLDPIDVFELLGFCPDQYNLSPGLQQVRKWFLERLYFHGRHTDLKGVMSNKGRKIAIAQIDELSSALSLGLNEFCTAGTVGSEDEIYGDKFRV